MKPPRLPAEFHARCREHGVAVARFVLCASIAEQSVSLFASDSAPPPPASSFQFVERFRCSTSKFGIGQVAGSNCTPLGLHRLAEKIGAGCPVGTIFKARQPVGQVPPGVLDATAITTRILWLEGLEPGFNRGGNVDTHDRYIYLHGTGDETTLGQPASHGCIHLAATDLIPLYDTLPVGTLVWIAAR